MKKKVIIIGIFFLLIAITVYPVSGAVNLKNLKIKEQNIINEQKIDFINGDDVEIYIYAGDELNNPAGPSFGIKVNIKVINNLDEAIWVYYQEDYFSLFSGKPIDAFQWKYQFVAPPHETHIAESGGGVPIPCRYRITVQAYVFEYVSRSGFQFRRFTFFPGEK